MSSLPSRPGRSAPLGLAIAVSLYLAASGVAGFSRPAAAQSACREAVITSPASGDAVQGEVPIFGSAWIDNFSFYKLEVATAYDPGVWSAVSTTISAPVDAGLLDVWNTSAFGDGDYALKLTVVNPDGQEVCHYTVSPVRVSNVATPTPSPSPTPAIPPTATPTFALDLVSEEEPTAQATIDPVIPIAVDPAEEGGSSASETAEALASDTAGAFLKGFVGALVLSGIALVIMAFRR